jgi:hypothetical protein
VTATNLPVLRERAMPANPVTLDNLKQGIRQVFEYCRKKGWPAEGEWEFHNDLYRALEFHRQRGFDKDSWSFMVDKLWSWRAIRPKTKQQIRAEGLKRFTELRRRFQELANGASGDLPSVESLDWGDVSPLFDIARQIKNVSRPTFASKLCHFLIPPAYFIIDGTLVKRGWKNYREYWEECREAWLRQPNKRPLGR